MDHTKDNVKRPVPILSRENWRVWFKEFEYWIIGEGLDFVVTNTLSEYAKIQGSATPLSTSSADTNKSIDGTNTRGFAMFDIKTEVEGDTGEVLNSEKRQRYRAANAKVLFMLSKCIGTFDQNFVENNTTAKGQWDALKAKYSKMTSVTRREDLQRITGFKFGWQDGKQIEMSIPSAWAYLVSVRGEIAVANPDLAKTFDQATLFEYLLAGLPESFSTVQQSLEGNTTADVYEKLEVLERSERKYRLNVAPEPTPESANLASSDKADQKTKSRRHKGRRRSSNTVHCHFCGQEHYKNQCELRQFLTQALADFQLSKARQEKKRNKRDNSTKRSFKTKRDKGLAADDEPSQEESSSGQDTSTEQDMSDEEEVCHLSKDKTPCKIPKSNWCSDSGCTKHMTDDPNLFRGAMVPIKRRTIKVGGGRLFADSMGQVEMRVAGVSLILDDVLYVPGLGVNLLSSRKLCQDWKCLGVFNDKSMWFISEDRRVVLQADVKGGLYIVSRIIPGRQGIELAMIGMLESLDHDEESESPISNSENDLCCHDALVAEDEDTHMHDDGEHGMRKLSKSENLTRYRLMHRRFAHLGPDKIRNLHKVTTLKRPVLVPTDREMCRVCKLTKLRNKTSKTLSPWKESILALVSLDVAGPFLPTIRGNRFFAQVVDNSTRKTWSLVDKTKSGLMTQIRKWKARQEARTQLKLGAVRSDNAAEIRELLDEWSKEGVVEESTTPYTGSHQNGVAERSIQQAETDARAMLKDADLPLEFWDWAVEADTYIRNRTSGGPLIDGLRISPEEAYTGEKPSIDHIRVFGSVCYSYVSPKSMPTGMTSKKLLDSGSECVFVGYNEETTKQLKVYRPDLGYTVTSSVVDVDESKQGGSLDLRIRGPNTQGTPADQFMTQGTRSNLPQRQPVGRPKKEEAVPIVETLPAVRNNFSIEIPAFKPPPQQKQQAVKKPSQGASAKDPTADTLADKEESSAPSPPKPSSSEPERTSDQPTKSQPDVTVQDVEPQEGNKRKDHDTSSLDSERAAKRLKAFLAQQQAEIHALICQRIYELEEDEEEAAFIATGGTVNITIPMTYNEAVNDAAHGHEWKAAIQTEIAALVANGTWREEKAPQGSNLVSTKWVFTTKTKPDGSLERFKARLVARGFSQIHGEDYDQTFAPTVRTDTLRIFLAMVAANDLECRQYDVKNAFTESSLRERIYLSPPKGVHVTPGLQLRVLRSLYGLKQSARDWNLLCKSELQKLGFKQSLADPCLFTHADKGITLLVYVDDIAAAALDKSALSWFYNNFRKRFNTKDLGEISKILGMRITRNRHQRELFLDQEQYLEKVLLRLGLPVDSSSSCKPRPTPVSGRYEKLEPARDDEEKGDVTNYQRAVGSIMYAMVYSRPDIAFHIGQLSQQLRNPTVRHESAVKELGRYLRSTIRQKIRYGPANHGKFGPTKEARLKVFDPDMLSLYSDADWANMTDRKSISGYVVMLFNGPIAYGSRKQRSVSTSSCESEYIGMSTCCKQGQWIAQVLRDMGFPEYIGKDPEMVEMRADNQGAIALAKNPHLHERSKHIDISYHHIRDLEERKKIKISYVPTTRMVADGFTKPLERVAFERFKDMLGLVDPARIHQSSGSRLKT